MRYMKKEEILRILVVFIIPLIILMPFSSAVFLGSVSVSGSDGIPNVRRGLDYTTVSVQVSDAGNGSLLSQLTFDTPHGFHQPPTSCEGGTCYFTSDTGFLTPNVYTATANYPGVASASASFVVDGDAPTTVELTVGQEKDKVKANYYVHDPEYGGTNTMTCSGINKLEFYVDGELDSTVDVSADNGTGTKVCEYEGEAELSVNTNGEHEVFIKSYDALGNFKSSIIRPFETDFTPAVISNTFSLFKDSVEMDYIRTAGGKINDIEIRFTITEESDLSLLKADLSEVGGGTDDSIYPYASGNSNNKCLFTSANNTWDCRFHVSLELSSNNPSIHVSLEDRYGIEVSQSLTGNFITDNDNATLKFLGTDVCHENVCYVNGDEVRFIAELYDKGSGFRNELVEGGRGFIFNLEDFGLGYVNAENCTQSGSDWDCYYDADLSGVSLGNGDEKEVYMYAASEDDAGNPVVEADTANGTVIVDTSAPEMYGDVVVQESVGGRTDWFQEGDNLDFIINFIEDESVILAENAFADFSNIVGDDEPDLYTNVTAEECGEGVLTEIIVNNETNETVESMVYECRWNVENVAPTGSNVFDKVTFSVSDIVGNVVEEEDYVWILTISTEENPNYFVYTAGEPLPPLIDRRAIVLTDYGIWVPIYVTEYLSAPHGGTAVPLRAELLGCTEPGSNSFINGDPIIFGDVLDAGNFSLFVQFNRGNYDNVTGIEFDCEFDIISKYGYTISNAENESVHVEVGLFDSEYKPLDEAFIDKIKKNTILMRKWGTWINKLDRFINNLKKFCGTATMLTKIDRIISDMEGVMLGVASAVYLVSPSAANDVWDIWHNNVFCKYKWLQSKLNTVASPIKIEERLRGIDQGDTDDKGKQKEGWLRQACNILSCSHGCWGWGIEEIGQSKDKVNEFLKDEGNLGLVKDLDKILEKKIGGKKSLKDMGFPSMSGGSLPGMGDGIFMATACGCAPLIISHLSKYQQIECQYVRCMFEMATQGAPWEGCQYQKDVDTCKYVVGPFMSIVPNPFQYIQSVMSWAADIVRTVPQRTISAAIGVACVPYRKAMNNSGGCESKGVIIDAGKNALVAACGVSESIASLEDLNATFQDDWNLKDFINIDSFAWNSDEGNCMKNRDIEALIEEMDALESD